MKRPKPFRRAGFVRRSWYRFRQLPYFVTIGVTLVLLNGALAAAYFGYQRYAKNEDNKANVARWEKFNSAAKTGDEDKMKAALEEIVNANPNEKIAAQRLKALETGEADPTDGQMALLTFQKHLRANPPKWPEAEREARKRLEHYPKDWLARCVVAQAALVKKDVDAATAELNLLPDLNKEDVNVHPGGLLFAFNLFAETRRDPTPLRQFVSAKVVDRIRSPDTKSWPLVLRLSIIECYVRAFDPESESKQLDGLNRAVAPVGELAESCLLEAGISKDEGALLRLGSLCNQLGSVFGLLRKDDKLGEEQYEAISKDLADRSERIWRTAIEINPKSVAGYKGSAIAELRKKNPKEAQAIIVDGLKQCGDQPELLAFYSHLLRANSDAKESVMVMAKAASADPKNLQLWLQLADAASAVGDIPLAAEAVEKARTLAPDDARTIRAGAWLALVRQEPGQAVFLLNKFDKAALAKDATLARWYVRAMIDGGLNASLPAFLKVVEDEAIRANQPAALAAALKAVNEADRYEADATKAAIIAVDRLLDRWRDNIDLMTAQSMAYYRIAENSEPRWELAATKNALRSLDRLRAKMPENADLSATVAWLRLKGEKNANLALLNASVLADLRKNDLPMSGWQMQVLGSVYLANDRAADAIAILEKARAAGAGTPGVLIPLALAYHKAKKWDEATQYIEIVRSQKRSPQEQADFLEAVLIFKPQ